MPTPQADPIPQGTHRAPDQGEELLRLFKGADAPDAEEAAPEAPDDEQPVTEEAAPTGDADAEEDAPADEETPTEEPETPTRYTVMVDGKVEQVTLEDLQAGYSRTGDYTRKTMALADERRKVEADSRSVTQERERLAGQLKNVEDYLATQLGAEPDWQKMADELEPAEFNRRRAAWDTKQRQVNSVRSARAVEEQRLEQERQHAHAEYVRAEQGRLYAAIPEWKDDAKAKAEQNEIVAYALREGKDYGITEDSIAGIDSAFPMLMLRKAMLYDKLKAAAPKVTKQPVPTPTARPGAKTVTTTKKPAQRAFERLVQTGDPKDAEELFLQKIADGSLYRK